MNTINIRVEGKKIKADTHLTVNGTVGLIELRISFDSYWNQFPAKQIIFSSSNMSKKISKDILGDVVLVPYEILTKAGKISIAIKGENTVPQTERTETKHIICQKQTLQNGDNEIEPTPSQYAQFVEEVETWAAQQGYIRRNEPLYPSGGEE